MRISAPAKVFEPREAVEAYLRLCSAPLEARPADVVAALRAPSRGLPLEREAGVAEALRSGATFTEALAAVIAAGARRRLDEAAAVLERLVRLDSALSLVRELRARGGLDKHSGPGAPARRGPQGA